VIDLDAIIESVVGTQRIRAKGAIDLDAIVAQITGTEPGHGVSQRWRERRDFYRPNAEEFDPEDWRVDLMAGKRGKAVREGGLLNTWDDGLGFIVSNHYSASYPQIRVMVGMFRASDARLVGVATFGNVLADVRGRFGTYSEYEVAELNRFVLLDEVPGNAETWFLAQAKALAHAVHALRGHELKAVVSYSDPVPRRDAGGSLVMPGHCGNIYQAHNALYLGYSASKVMHLDPDGREPHPRMLAKIRKLDAGGEKGSEEARRRFERYGVDPRRRGESYTDWVERSLSSPAFRRISHAGNLTYAWALGDKRVRRAVKAAMPPVLAYPPKTPRQLYLNLGRKYQRAWSRGNVSAASAFASKILEVWLSLSPSDQQSVPPPPQVDTGCPVPSAGKGSASYIGWTLDQLLPRVVCR
jgi:hypothetical protein